RHSRGRAQRHDCGAGARRVGDLRRRHRGNVVEREYRPGVATFYAPGVWERVVPLAEGPAHHAFVKRLSPGATVRLSGGDGRRTTGTIAKMDKRSLLIDVGASPVEIVPPFPQMELWAPIGDRDRT